VRSHANDVGEAPDTAQTYVYLMREGFGAGQVIVVHGRTVLARTSGP
jgi:hypothetical protein